MRSRRIARFRQSTRRSKKCMFIFIELTDSFYFNEISAGGYMLDFASPYGYVERNPDHYFGNYF